MIAPSVRTWLVERTRLEPSLLEGAGFEALVRERIGAYGGTESAYLAHLDRAPDEVDRLIAGIAVPETWLFRYPRSYDLLVEFLQRRLASGASMLRMASIGCATGQEPWCMAMCALHAGWPADRVRIDGFDRNPDFLRIAERGEYGSSSIRSEIPAWAMGSLGRAGEAITIDPIVRPMVLFTRADVTAFDVLSRTEPRDAIFCRNLLIYLNADARRRLVDALCAALAPGGLLFVGHAEQIVGTTTTGLRPVPAPHAFALERTDSSAVRPVFRAAPSRPIASGVLPRPTSRPLSSAPSVPDDSFDDARDLADAGRIDESEAMVRSIMARRGPTATALELLGMIRMAVDDAPGAKRFFEQATYLEPDRSTSLLQLAILSERAGDAPRAATLWERARKASSSADREART